MASTDGHAADGGTAVTGAGLAATIVAYQNPGSMDASSLDTGVLWSDDVAALWSELAEREIKPSTVWSYLDKSKPADPATGREAGRYADDPVPTPAGYKGGRPFWRIEQIPALTAWWERRRGRIGDPRSAGDRNAGGKRT